MFGGFIREEKAQSDLEFIVLVSGIIVAMSVVLAINSSMTESAATNLNESTGRAVRNITNRIKT